MKPVHFIRNCLSKNSPLVLLGFILSACGSGQNLNEQVDPIPDIGQAITSEASPVSLPVTAPVEESSTTSIPVPAVAPESPTVPITVFTPESPEVSIPVSGSEAELLAVSIPVPESESENPIESRPDQTAEPVPPPVSAPETGSVSELMSAIVVEEISCDADLEVFKIALLELTNRSRQIDQVCGSTRYEAVPPLEWDDSLREAAHSHSNDMATHNFFSHTGSDGSRSFQRAMTAGFPSGTIGENIAAGQPTSGIVQDSWMESTGHCTNIMRSSYTHLGASCVVDTDADFQRYWTVVFGRK